MRQLLNYACGQWVAGADKGQDLFNAITGDALATASSKGLDFARMCDYARTVGGPKLRKMTFQERGLMLKALALHLQTKKEEFYKISWANGWPGPIRVRIFLMPLPAMRWLPPAAKAT